MTKSASPKTTTARRAAIPRAPGKAAAPVRKAGAAAGAATQPRAARPAVAKSTVKAKSSSDKPVVAAETREKAKKPKLVRDSFTMPEDEYAVLGDVKKACLKAGIEVKKSELLRVGVALVRQIDLGRLSEILAGLPTLKAGRPKKVK